MKDYNLNVFYSEITIYMIEQFGLTGEFNEYLNNTKELYSEDEENITEVTDIDFGKDQESVSKEKINYTLINNNVTEAVVDSNEISLFTVIAEVATDAFSTIEELFSDLILGINHLDSCVVCYGALESLKVLLSIELVLVVVGAFFELLACASAPITISGVFIASEIALAIGVLYDLIIVAGNVQNALCNEKEFAVCTYDELFEKVVQNTLFENIYSIAYKLLSEIA